MHVRHAPNVAILLENMEIHGGEDEVILGSAPSSQYKLVETSEYMRNKKLTWE